MVDKFCKIYATGGSSVEELLSELGKLFNASRETRSFISTEQFDIAISVNDEFDSVLQKDVDTGFLYFQYLIDINFNEKETLEFCIDLVSQVLHWLQNVKGMRAVASCDYEDLLR